MHYRGEINIGDYWHVGDTKKIHINEVDGNTYYVTLRTVPSQDIEVVIIGIDHDDLATPINGKTKAALTLQFKDNLLLLDENSSEAGGDGINNTGTTEPNDWNEIMRRTWCNEIFLSYAFDNAIDNKSIYPLIKQVVKKNLANHHDDTAGISTKDYVFLLSVSEIYGSEPKYLIGYESEQYHGSEKLEGNQYEYFKIEKNRIKGVNNYSDSGYTWWTRTPGDFGDYRIDIFFAIFYNGTTSNIEDSPDAAGICPSFCL